MADQDTERGLRARTFGAVAEEYGRLRPAPCGAAVDWLVPEGCGRVLDLAAGAGTLTAMLGERAGEVVAVEPDDRMRAALSGRCPDATVLNGTAEELPLPDGQLDAVAVASAWHWFDPERAVPEIARVLRPGGRLSVVWNTLDVTVPWVAEWYAGLRPDPATAREAPDRRLASRGARLREDLRAAGPLFEDPEENAVTCTRRTTPADAAALLGTYSRVIMLPPEDRRRLLAKAETTLRTRLSLPADETFDLPFRSLCWRTTRTTTPAPAARG